MFVKVYSDFQCIVPSFVRSPRIVEDHQSKIWMASFKLDRDVSPLFPYINSTSDNAVYYEQPEHMRFLLKGYRCVLYSRTAVTRFFESKTTATLFASDLIDYLNYIYEQKENITPNYAQIKHIPIIDILRVLPKTNCRECGYLSCVAFAVGIIKGKVAADKCPRLDSPMNESAAYPVLDENGNIVDSVALPISTSKLKNRIQEQHEQILELEASLKTNTHHHKIQDISEESGDNDFGLTRREIEVLRLIAEGYTNNEISGMLFISSHTVKSHMINIFNKLNVNDRTQAAVMATRNKII